VGEEVGGSEGEAVVSTAGIVTDKVMVGKTNFRVLTSLSMSGMIGNEL